MVEPVEFKSASLTFSSKKHGFLLCKEERDRKIVYHPIGGKCEKTDTNIAYTACREFIEEASLEKSNHSLSQLYEMVMNPEYTSYYDHFVNVEKKYVHRYYIVNIDGFERKLYNQIVGLPNTFKQIQGKNQSNTRIEHIESLEWNKEIVCGGELDKKKYSMLTIYLSNILHKLESYDGYKDSHLKDR